MTEKNWCLRFIVMVRMKSEGSVLIVVEQVFTVEGSNALNMVGVFGY